MFIDDTIVAIATPIGKGGVGIVRVSGPKAKDCANKIIGHTPKNRYAEYTSFKDGDGNIIDRGIAIFFEGPNSFTGEDVVEFQAHGGPIVLDILMKEILKIKDLRIADPGEFSKRAFFNDKIDLTQAEAIADLIDANTEQAARFAVNSLEGKFSKLINALVQDLINIRAYIEASIDFSDEHDIDFLSEGKILQKIKDLKTKLTNIKHQAQNGSTMQEGIKLVIVGKPNAGKSSLLNQFSGRDTAIVTSIAGTTRDVLHANIQIDGIPIHIVDTAGLRETDNTIEKIGIERAWNEINNSNFIILMIDSTLPGSENQSFFEDVIAKLPSDIPITIALNKVDCKHINYQTNLDSFNYIAKNADNKSINVISISAKDGFGLKELKEQIKKSVGFISSTEGNFIARRRHIDAIEKADMHIDQSIYQLEEFNAAELVAEELKMAQENLNLITGKFTSDDLLGKIFSSFCIGK